MSDPVVARDKRDAFRIDEDVHFEFHPINTLQASESDIDDAFAGHDESLKLIHQLSRIDREANQCLSILADKNRLLGDFLQALNKKIDLIGRHIAFNSEESLKNRPRRRVSLSEDGIGFICDRALYKDSHLALRLVFLPSYAMVSAFARVVRCVQRDEHYQVAVKFVKISDRDRQTISRQVLKSQVRARQQNA